MDDWQPRPAIYPSEWLEEPSTMNDQRFYSLIEIKDSIDEICQFLNVACDDVRMWSNDRGERGYTARIEPCSPQDAGFISHLLAVQGFSGVEVVGRSG